ACQLCQRSEADPNICGEKLERYGLCAHVFCLFFANHLFPQRNKRAGFLGLLPKDIQYTIDQAAQKHCFICGQSGATITCCERDCDLSFHLPCAKEAGCVTQYITPYRSFCPAHSPEQVVQATPEPDTQCLMCMEPVEDRKTYNTMVCPACKTAWFHRDCVQNQAIHSGFSIFSCPHCQNEYRFVMEMLIMGIRIPRRGPSWEEHGAYEQLYERHSHCNASECLFLGGREEAEEEGPWKLLLCSSCAAEGTHRCCSGLRESTSSWECDNCA
ncbi:PHF7 protein, partial [Xiphorhynchus elegans]|nr:PHF7 protein [Xiphorhynchus elegans]